MEINFNKLFHVENGGDKIAHFIAGLIIGVISFFLIPNSVFVLAPVLIVASLKELYDKYIKKSNFDFFDFFATMLGGWLAIIGSGAVMGFIG